MITRPIPAVLLAMFLVVEPMITEAYPHRSDMHRHTDEEFDNTVMKRSETEDQQMPRFQAVHEDPAVGAASGGCHPICRWACNDPECPAMCHPICETPKCEVSCEQTPCARCKVRCAKPVCSIRCPKDMCERNACPKCQVICAPGECHTECQTPDPVCAPVCETPVCKWKCKKPTSCPRPKCKLQCQRATCEDGRDSNDGGEGCCPCDQAKHAMAAIEIANSLHQNVSNIDAMSLLEVVDHARHYHKGDATNQCCPCGDKKMDANSQMNFSPASSSTGSSKSSTLNLAKVAHTLS